MSIDVYCPGCNKAYSVPDERAGQRFKCKQCGTAVSVPADEWGYGSGEDAFGGKSGGFPTSGPADFNNPYAAPIVTTTGGQRISRAEALSKTNVCAIFLYIVTGLSILNHVAGAIMAIGGANMNPFVQNRPPANQAEEIGQMVGGIAGGVVGLVMDILVIVGAYNLQKLNKYGLAMTGAIIACIPCCGPCLVLGIPFGIWALVLLNNAQIRPHFQ